MAQRGMKFGIFLAPFHSLGENPTLAMARDMELIEWLDWLGYDEAWIGEHHSAGWEVIASPEIFIAQAADRTRHIKLGSGVTSLPYHHPFLVAQRFVHRPGLHDREDEVGVECLRGAFDIAHRALHGIVILVVHQDGYCLSRVQVAHECRRAQPAPLLQMPARHMDQRHHGLEAGLGDCGGFHARILRGMVAQGVS